MVELFAIRIPEQEQSPQELERLLSLVNQPFREKVGRFRLQKDALRSIGGRLGILWYLTTRGLIRSREEAVFGIKGQGKPVLVSPTLEEDPIDYNIAHDGDYVLLAVIRGWGGKQVGVDIMAVEQHLGDLEEALSEQMTVRERQMVGGCTTRDAKARALITIWCAKEAYVKALGEGVGFGLERIDVVISDQSPQVMVKVDGHDIREAGWSVMDGYLEEKAYRWVCIAQVEPEDDLQRPRLRPEPISIRWTDMVADLQSA